MAPWSQVAYDNSGTPFHPGFPQYSGVSGMHPPVCMPMVQQQTGMPVMLPMQSAAPSYSTPMGPVEGPLLSTVQQQQQLQLQQQQQQQLAVQGMAAVPLGSQEATLLSATVGKQPHLPLAGATSMQNTLLGQQPEQQVPPLACIGVGHQPATQHQQASPDQRQYPLSLQLPMHGVISWQRLD